MFTAKFAYGCGVPAMKHGSGAGYCIAGCRGTSLRPMQVIFSATLVVRDAHEVRKEESGVSTVNRQCCSCVWFHEGARSFEGRCLHPARQLPYDPQPWVRHRELACRLDWDHDLWEPGDVSEDWLIDIRIIDPDDPNPFSPRRDLLQRLLVLPGSALPADPYEMLVGEEIVCD
jgi:hypothetical protein